MVIVVDVRTHRSVIVIPLLLRDLEVLVHISEGLQEVAEDLLFGHLAGADFGMVAGVVDAFEVLRVDEPRAVPVELKKRPVDDHLPSLVRLTLGGEWGKRSLP